MFCSKCGTQLNDDADFCFKCGSKAGAESTAQTKTKTREDWMLETIKAKILPSLKTPATAKFGQMRDYAKDDYGRAYVAIDIDSQNSYGAVMRMTFNVLFDKVNDDGLGIIKIIEEDMNKKSFLARLGSKAMGDWKVAMGFGKPR